MGSDVEREIFLQIVHSEDRTFLSEDRPPAISMNLAHQAAHIQTKTKASVV